MDDYTKIPRSLIYKDRTSLKDFGVQDPGSINYYLFSNLKEIYMATDRAKELILRCFNNAYYICTLIPLEDMPDLQVDEYEQLLMKDDAYDREEVCALSMAMVAKLMQAYDERWRDENSDLIKAIKYRFTHYQWMNMGARRSFETMIGKQNTDGLSLPPGEFEPRDIVEVIIERSPEDLILNAEYVCERLALVDEPRRRMYGADTAIGKLNNLLRETYESYGYDPMTKKFEEAEPGTFCAELELEDQLQAEVKPIEAAIYYYTEHYPKANEDDSTKNIIREDAKTDGVSHEVEVKNLQAQIKTLKAENEGLKKQLEDAGNTNVQQTIQIGNLNGKIKDLEEKKKELSNQKHDEWVVELFSHFCYGDISVAQKIIDEMRDKGDPEIADIIFEQRKKNKISPKTNNIEMWRVLHAAKIIESDSYQNLDTALRRRKRKNEQQQ